MHSIHVVIENVGNISVCGLEAIGASVSKIQVTRSDLCGIELISH